MGALDAASALIRANRGLDPKGLKRLLGKTGRFPPIELILTPLDRKPQISLNRFLDYTFTSSIVTPVDTFSFNFVAPDSKVPTPELIKGGDIVRIDANKTTLATGIIDTVDIEVSDDGETASIGGRDLMSQYEDNDSINIDDDPIWKNAYTITQAIEALNKNTRINKIKLSDAPKKPYLFATEPGETKLSSLQRFLEPLNCVAWMSPDGRITIGRPNMSQSPKGTLFLNKEKRQSNVTSIKAVRQATKVPNIIVPIWVGQEITQSRTPKQNRVLNNSADPARLRKFDHRVIKTVVVSTPEGDSAQDLAEVNRLKAAGQNLLQAHAKREMAKSKMEELQVQVSAPGHYNDQGEPFVTDTIYKIECDRASVDENMYLYQVEYSGSEESGQKTVLSFCRLGSIVSDIKAP